MANNKQTYDWSFADVRSLDSRLANLESTSKTIQADIKDIKEELAIKNHVVVDNRTTTDWKGIAAIVTAVIGATILTLSQIFGK